MPNAKVNAKPLTRRQERLLYLRKWLRHGRRIASVAPSSRALSEATCGRIDARTPQTILELGAGTGAVTRVAAAAMHPDSRLVAIERDPDFARALDNAVPRAEVVVGDACDLAAILQARGIDHVDVVLNGLPTPSLTVEQRRRIADAIAGLADQPWVSQITVMPWVYQGFYRCRFEEVRFQPVFRNLRPGGVYHCRGVRP
ncbi:NAD-binding protein [Ectothiorhodospiraceae bacterium WFHF3C12]|nr:NAD-binding protein [Ectothiorhodospiraceae bacterium WFHF3C12]